MDKIFKLKRLRLTSALAALLLTSAASAANIQDAVHQTLSTHPNVLGAQAAEKAARYDVNQAKGEYLPSVDIEGGIGKEHSDNPATRASGNHGRTLTRQESAIVASQLIFDGGNVMNTIRQRKSDLETSKFQLSETQESLAFEATEAYLNVKRNRELVAIERSNVNAHQKTLAKVRKRLKAGAGRKSEAELAEARLALANSELQQARGRLADANDSYLKVVGQSVPKVMRLPTLPHVPASLSSAQNIAAGQNPSLGAVESQVDASNYAVGVAKSNFWPTFRADLGATFQNDLDGVKGHNNDAEAMVRMTYNIFNGGSDKAGVDAAIARHSQARHDAQNTRRDVNEDVAISWNNLRADQRRLPYLKRHRDKSRNVLTAYGKQFQLGQRTLFDLLNAETEYNDARAAYVDARYDVRIGTYRLLASMGTLVSTLYDRNHNIVAKELPDHSKPYPMPSPTPSSSHHNKKHGFLDFASNNNASTAADATVGQPSTTLAQASPTTTPSSGGTKATAANASASSGGSGKSDILLADNKKAGKKAKTSASTQISQADTSTGFDDIDEFQWDPAPTPDNKKIAKKSSAPKKIVKKSSSNISNTSNTSKGYTIQVMAAHEPETVLAYAKKHKLGQDAHYFRKDVKGEIFYVLTIGDFARKMDAENALISEKAMLGGTRPEIHSMASLHKQGSPVLIY